MRCLLSLLLLERVTCIMPSCRGWNGSMFIVFCVVGSLGLRVKAYRSLPAESLFQTRVRGQPADICRFALMVEVDHRTFVPECHLKLCAERRGFVGKSWAVIKRSRLFSRVCLSGSDFLESEAPYHNATPFSLTWGLPMDLKLCGSKIYEGELSWAILNM